MHDQLPTSWLSKGVPTRRVKAYPTSTAALRSPAAAQTTRVVRDREPRGKHYGRGDECDIANAEQRCLLDGGNDLQEVDPPDREQRDHSGRAQDRRVGVESVRGSAVEVWLTHAHELSFVHAMQMHRRPEEIRQRVTAACRARCPVSLRSGVVDLDLAVVLPDLDVRQRRERLAELLAEHIALQRERRAVARAVEASRGFVVAEQAALVRAHPGDRGEIAVVVHDEADGRRGGEARDLTVAEIGGREDRLPGALVGNELLCLRDRR